MFHPKNYKRLKFKFILLLLLALFISPGIFAQTQAEEEKKPEPLTRILFVLDASQSMYGRWQSDMKISIARKLLTNLLDSLESVENIELALRVYGHQYRFPPQVCNDTKLMVPFGEQLPQRVF